MEPELYLLSFVCCGDVMFMSCGYYIFAMAGRLTRLSVAMQK